MARDQDGQDEGQHALEPLGIVRSGVEQVTRRRLQLVAPSLAVPARPSLVDLQVRLVRTNGGRRGHGAAGCLGRRPP
jgi:hypothetical protein